MKKLIYLPVVLLMFTITACNSATDKKGGNGADSGATGSSGAAASAPAGNGSAAGNSNATTDTSTTGAATTNPTVDSTKTRP